MLQQHRKAEIAAFIRSKGVTRCPTACAAPTHACGNAVDRPALRERADQLEAARQQQFREFWLRGTPAPFR